MQSLQEIRESKGIKLNSVAQHIGVSRQTYRKYEKNPGSMTIDQALSVCNFIGCSVDEIFLSCNVK